MDGGWPDGSADVPKTATTASGSATFTCSDGVWSAPTGATCNAGCPNTHVGDKGSKCSRTDTLHGSSDGSCDEDGVCSYECDNGRWNETSNGCHPWDKCLADPDHEWTVGTRACQGALPEIAHGAEGRADDDTAPVTGSVRYSCDDGNRTEASATCGRECAASDLTWTVGAQTCGARLPTTAHLDAPTAKDATYPASGSATFTCNDGVWSAPTAATCVAGCAGQAVSWNVAHQTCTAELSDALDADTPTITANAPYSGSATFACSSGTWGSATETTCSCDAECVCALAGGDWILPQPERERTCTGNNGCTNHSHSCTTPADPDGGYQSCTYKKHKGGLQCASHSHHTCDPFPATNGHCHIEIDPDQCPLCHPF